jgi:hypothetical protein
MGVYLANLDATETTDDNDVEGNYIGLNATGTATLNPTGNGGYGVLVATNGCAHAHILGNRIAGYMVNIDLGDYPGASPPPTTGVVIDGNYLGTNASGTAAMPGSAAGVAEIASGGGNTISNNLISGNTRQFIGQPGKGVFIQVDGDVVEGNLIGTDVSGTHPIPNGVGITNYFGGNGEITGNTIEFNDTGIDVGSNNVITGNTVAYNSGLAADSGSGVRVGYSAEAIGNRIEGNAIYGNSGPGVWVAGGPLVPDSIFPFPVGNSISSNSIHDNGGLGIDLGDIPYDSAGNVTSDPSQWFYSKPDGVTLNDSHTLAFQGQVVGPNHFQTFPLLSAVSGGAGGTAVSGTFNSTGAAPFTIEFFANTGRGHLGPDGKYYGEGQTSLGTYVVNGSGPFTATGLLPIPAGQGYITATATDANGNTSEFSQDLNVPPSNLVLTQSAAAITEGGAVTLAGSFQDPTSLDTHTVAIDWGDGSPPIILNLPAGVLAFAGISHQYADNPAGQPHGSFPINVTVTDQGGGSVTSNTSIEVDNVAPTVGAISAPISPAPVGTPISASASFSDPGVLDTHTAVWDWGDGTTSAGTISEANGSGTVAGSHAYAAAGVYTVKLTVTDKDGATAQSLTQQWVYASGPVHSAITSNFNGTDIQAGNTIWFSQVASVSGVDKMHGTTIWYTNVAITFSGTTLHLPNTVLIYSPTATAATTVFDTASNTWQTIVPVGQTGNVFLSGYAYLVLQLIPGGSVSSITWSGDLYSSTAGASLTTKWAAAVYNTLQYPSLFLDLNAVEILPVDGSDHAGTPEGTVDGVVVKKQVLGGARGGGGSNYTGGYSGSVTLRF